MIKHSLLIIISHEQNCVASSQKNCFVRYDIYMAYKLLSLDTPENLVSLKFPRSSNFSNCLPSVYSFRKYFWFPKDSDSHLCVVILMVNSNIFSSNNVQGRTSILLLISRSATDFKLIKHSRCCYIICLFLEVATYLLTHL